MQMSGNLSLLRQKLWRAKGSDYSFGPYNVQQIAGQVFMAKRERRNSWFSSLLSLARQGGFPGRYGDEQAVQVSNDQGLAKIP